MSDLSPALQLLAQVSAQKRPLSLAQRQKLLDISSAMGEVLAAAGKGAGTLEYLIQGQQQAVEHARVLKRLRVALLAMQR